MTNPTNRTLSENSLVQQTEVILRLVQGMPVGRIIEETGVPKSRLTRWQKDPDFLALYEQTEQQMADQLRSEAVDLIRKRLDFLGPKAIEVLEEGLAAEKLTDRMNAAKAILAFQGKSTPRQAPAQVIPIEAAIRAKATDVSPAAGD